MAPDEGEEDVREGDVEEGGEEERYEDCLWAVSVSRRFSWPFSWVGLVAVTLDGCAWPSRPRLRCKWQTVYHSP